mgnify:CR=1 FL=1
MNNPSSLGFETARSLAFQGCTVVFACRDVEKGHTAVKKVLKQRPFAKCHVLKLNLESLVEVKGFAQAVVTAFGYVLDERKNSEIEIVYYK